VAAYIFMALTNAAEGQEAAYGAYLDEVHVPEVLTVPGVAAAQRYELTDEQRMRPPPPFRFATVYELETDDLAATLTAIRTAAKTAVKSATGDPNSRAAWIYRPVGERRLAAPAREGSCEP